MSKKKHDTAASATMTGIFDRFKKVEKIGELEESDRIDGKVCLITGSSSGLGLAAAVALAKRGARVIMAVRSKIPEAGELVKKKSGSDAVEMIHLDLCSFASVRAFCGEVKNRGLRFDIAVFNAGVVAGSDRKTEDGFDEMLQVNYLAKFVLVNTLIHNGNISADGSPGRVIFTSSEAHRSGGEIDVNTLAEYRGYSMKGSMLQYGKNKLYLTSFFNELVRRRPGISFYALCPGPVNSNIARDAPKILHPFMKLFFLIFFRSPNKAAEPILYFACKPGIEDKSGTYIHLMEEKPVSPGASDPEKGRELWERSAELLTDYLPELKRKN